jgi:hypothetical protein
LRRRVTAANSASHDPAARNHPSHQVPRLLRRFG